MNHICEEMTISEETLQKDLYATLGLSPSSSEKVIRQTYRKLAKQYHPDKSSGSDSKAMIDKFHEIVEAYEVLSNPRSREQYDEYQRFQKANSQRNSKQSQSHSHYQNQNYQKDSYQQQNRFGWEDVMNPFDSFFQSFSQPWVAVSVLSSNRYIYPYAGIIVSEDRSHFAILDELCSIGIYEGDMNLVFSNSYGLSSIHELKTKYKTPENRDLQGNCFAVLDNFGVLSIYGEVMSGGFFPSRVVVWQSESNVEMSMFSSMYTNFYLELSDFGELIVQMITRDITKESEPSCVWSTRSCRNMFSIVIDIRNMLQSQINNLMKTIRRNKHVKFIVKLIKRIAVQLHLPQAKKKCEKYFKVFLKSDFVRELRQLWRDISYSPLGMKFREFNRNVEYYGLSEALGEFFFG